MSETGVTEEYLQSFYGKDYIRPGFVRCGFCDNEVEFLGLEYLHVCDECKQELKKFK